MEKEPSLLPPDYIQDLRKQHVEYVREGYDGHKRHSGLTTMHDLSVRRARRNENRFLAKVAGSYSHANQISSNNVSLAIEIPDID